LLFSNEINISNDEFGEDIEIAFSNVRKAEGFVCRQLSPLSYRRVSGTYI